MGADSVKPPAYIEKLPDELLIYIFEFLPSTDVAVNCSRVCKRWKYASRNTGMWVKKCRLEKKYLVNVMGPIPNDIVKFYFKSPYTRNLLRNTHAMEGMKHWRNGLGGKPLIESALTIETFVPAAERQGRVKNWAGSYLMTGLFQWVDLWKLALPDALMDETRPPIAVSVWCTCDILLPSWFYMTVKLRDTDSHVVMEKTESVLYTQRNQRGIWCKIETTLTNYKPGVRNIYLEMGGRCRDLCGLFASWGPKYTLPCVRFVFDSQ